MSDNVHIENSMEASEGLTAGSILSKKREQLGMSEKEAAEGLKISLARLRALEANRWNDFASETFIRGYLHNYCRLLDMDKAQVISVFEESRPPAQAVSLEFSGAVEVAETSSNKKWIRAFVVIVVLAVIWGAAYWFLSPADVEEPASLGETEVQQESDALLIEEAAPVDPVIATSEPATQVIDDPDLNLIDEDQPLASDVSEDPVANPELEMPEISEAEQADKESEMVVSKITAAELVRRVQLQPEPAEEPEPVIPEGDTLSFQFSNACWVKVTDASGAVLYTALQRAGSKLELSGEAPFQVVVGNVEGTSLMYNGEPVDLTPPRGRKDLSLRVGE